jgi:hypothetical protein
VANTLKEGKKMNNLIRTMEYTTAEDGFDDDDIAYFTEYFNGFYGVNGVYPLRDVTNEAMILALQILFADKPGYNFRGDSVDREAIRDIIFSQLDQHYMYNNKKKER